MDNALRRVCKNTCGARKTLDLVSSNAYAKFAYYSACTRSDDKYCMKEISNIMKYVKDKSPTNFCGNKCTCAIMNTVKKYAPPDVKSLSQSTMKMWLNAQKTKCEGLDTCDLSLKTGDALERENQEAKAVGKAELQKHLEEGGTEYMVTTKKELTGVTLKFCQDNVDKFETDLRNGGGSPLRLSITFAEISSRMLES